MKKNKPPLAEIYKELVDRGWTRERKYTSFDFIKQIEPGILADVGLLRSTNWSKSNAPWISPIVGVINLAVEDYLALIVGQPHRQATLQTCIGYVMPESSDRMWYFDTDIPIRINEMCDAIDEYGPAYARSLADPHLLLDEMLRDPKDFNNWYRTPILFVMLGEIREARKHMKKYPPEGVFDLSPEDYAKRLFERVRPIDQRKASP
jgi:hypothetical protein